MDRKGSEVLIVTLLVIVVILVGGRFWYERVHQPISSPTQTVSTTNPNGTPAGGTSSSSPTFPATSGNPPSSPQATFAAGLIGGIEATVVNPSAGSGGNYIMCAA